MIWHKTVLMLTVMAIFFAGGCVSVTDAPPEITSATEVEATGGVYFSYHAIYEDPDDSANLVRFEAYPSWLTASSDSIFGIPPDGLADDHFIVIVWDGRTADTMLVTIDMIPSMAVYGDSRTGHAMHKVIVDSMMTAKPAVVFHTGDLVNDGYSQFDWDMFNSITAQMRAAAEFFPSLGNHENQSQLYFDNFQLPGNEQWYSVERNHTHFICLNSCVATDTASEQYQWLKNDLASVDDSIRFIVAYFHHPPYSTGPHGEDERGLRETWVPLFEQYDVDVVFNGHDHHYERSYCGNRFYIVTGGGGAPLRDQARTDPCSQLYIMDYHFCKLSVVGERMIVKVYDRTKTIIDEFTIDKTPISVD